MSRCTGNPLVTSAASGRIASSVRGGQKHEVWNESGQDWSVVGRRSSGCLDPVRLEFSPADSGWEAWADCLSALIGLTLLRELLDGPQKQIKG